MPINWKRVAQKRLAKLRLLEHQEQYRMKTLHEQLTRQLFMALHSACLPDSRVRAERMAECIVAALRIK